MSLRSRRCANVRYAASLMRAYLLDESMSYGFWNVLECHLEHEKGNDSCLWADPGLTCNIPRLSPFRIQRQLKKDDKLRKEKMKMFINKNQMSFFHLPWIYGAGAWRRRAPMIQRAIFRNYCLSVSRRCRGGLWNVICAYHLNLGIILIDFSGTFPSGMREEENLGVVRGLGNMRFSDLSFLTELISKLR